VNAATVLIDGYNVIHRIDAFREQLETAGLQAARDALIRYCIEWRATRGDVGAFTIVFDGSSDVQAQGESGPVGVRVIYTRTGETADDRIIALVRQANEKGVRVMVISGDNYVRDNTRSLGAEMMTADAFAATVRRGRARRQGGGTTDKQELPPHVKRTINDELKRVWRVEE
jgi:predicted RNA-binding protein with PIN domain